MVLIVLVIGTALTAALIIAGCYRGVEALCSRGDGIRDVTLEIIALLAIILGAARKPPN